MAGTYSQIYIQIVFATKGRESFILPSWEQQLFKYITGIVQNKGQKMIAINGMPDHIHLLVCIKPSCCISDLVREVKKASTIFVNENRLVPNKFSWQEGFGAFSYSRSSLDKVADYIFKQKIHHQKTPFRNEYIAMLSKFEIAYKQEYLFDWVD